MRGTTFSFLLAFMWPSLQALFTVESEQDSYGGELHKDVRIGCQFSPVKSISHLSVIWHRIEPLPAIKVYQLEEGVENDNFTDKHFWKRARLLKDELKNFRAVLELSRLQINDTGTYQCIIRQEEVDYKKTTLTVRAPYTPVKKSIRRLDKEEVELSCESQGFPLASVAWSDSRHTEVLQQLHSSNEKTSEGTFNITSRVTVKSDVNNYTCFFVIQGEVQQSVNFSIPGEIPGKTKWSHGFAAIGVIAVMCVGFTVTSLILHRRKKGQTKRDFTSNACLSDPQLTVTSTDSLLPRTSYFKAATLAFSSEICRGSAENLREVLRRRYAELDTKTEMSEFALQHCILCGENQQQEIQSIIPDRGETVLLQGKAGSGKSTLARMLAFSWANNLDSDPFSINKIRLVILVHFKGVAGDFFQVVGSKILNEAGLETVNLKEILLGNTDCLLILDSYKEGDRDMDESLIQFLKDRSTCRVLITAQPGEHGILGETVTKTLQLHMHLAET